MLVTLQLSVNAAPAYNYALGQVPVGTFSNLAAAVDGKLGTFAVSQNISEGSQFFTIDLGREILIGSVKVVWKSDALSNNYSIRVSKDKKNWFSEFSEVDASTGAADPADGTISQVISTARYTMPSRFIQIYIPMGSAASAQKVQISEVQVLPAQEMAFTLEEVKPYAVSNKRAVILYRTSIGAVNGQVLYGSDPNNLSSVAANSESGVINSAVLMDLEPGRPYYYEVKAWDTLGKAVVSDVKHFVPSFVNVALNKNVSGTFTELPPNDPLVDRNTPVLARSVDGLTDYFKGMATSRSIRSEDQEITVDLGASYPINSIVSYWRALAYPESFSVKISSDGAGWTELASKVNAGDGAFMRSGSGDPMRVINTDANGATARYVQVLIGKDSPFFVKHANWDFVQLMELEVLKK